MLTLTWVTGLMLQKANAKLIIKYSPTIKLSALYNPTHFFLNFSSFVLKSS